MDCSSTLEQHLVLLAELADAQELLYGQDGDQQEQDHSCPALAGNPTLRGLGAWFENGDGLNTKDQEAMDAEVTHVKLLQDPPHRFWTLHPTMQQRSEGSNKIDIPQKAKGRIP